MSFFFKLIKWNGIKMKMRFRRLTHAHPYQNSELYAKCVDFK